jgi:hypothetical protein
MQIQTLTYLSFSLKTKLCQRAMKRLCSGDQSRQGIFKFFLKNESLCCTQQCNQRLELSRPLPQRPAIRGWNNLDSRDQSRLFDR